MSTSDVCLACGSDRLSPVADLGETPVLNGVMFDSQESARAATLGRLDIAACRDCGHAQNVAFDPDLIDYDAEYDNSLHFSPTFQKYAESLASRLVDTYDLHGGRFVEIGSGKGDFLESITRYSGGIGVGYDPSTIPDRRIPNVTLLSEYYQPGQDVERYDLLVCRHVLEHLADPAAILRSVRSGAPAGAVHYFEVPAAEFDFGPTGMWDFIYPHVSYFSEQSLHTLLRQCGYEVVAGGRSFADQFLWVEARAANTVPEAVDPTEHLRLVDDFARRHAEVVRRWRTDIDERASRGEGTALWGAGSKGVSFLNLIDPRATMTVVDLNSRKWARFLPGSGHEVVAPASVPDRDVSKVFITNRAYRDEIAGQLRDLGVVAEVVAV